MNLGNKIRELRRLKNLTQEQLAVSLNISPQAVSKWEMGASYPDMTMIPTLAAFFRVTLDELFEERIKQPLGMTRSRFVIGIDEPNAAICYSRREPGESRLRVFRAGGAGRHAEVPRGRGGVRAAPAWTEHEGKAGGPGRD